MISYVTSPKHQMREPIYSHLFWVCVRAVPESYTHSMIALVLGVKIKLRGASLGQAKGLSPSNTKAGRELGYNLS